MRRWLAAGAVLIVAVAALVLALDGTLSHTSRRDQRRDVQVALGHARTSHSATATRPSGPPPLDARVPTAPTGAQAALRTAIDRALGPAGPQSGVFVYDLGARKALYATRAGVARPPASVEKLWTTVALLDRLGPGARLQTAVLGAGHQADSTWHGDLFLRGGGDPTFGDPGFNHVYEQGYGPTPEQLVAQLRRRGIRRVTGRVYGDESLFDARRGGLITGYRPDTPDFGGYLSALVYDHGTLAPHYVNPAGFATHVFAQMLRGGGIDAHAAGRDPVRRTPRSADLLATVQSPPVSVMTRLMDVRSDDLFAELLAKQLGVLFGHGGTITAGAAVIADTIASRYRLHPKIHDGSGLGRIDRTSPLQIVQLLADVWHTGTGRVLAASLPTVGVDGTVEGIAARTAARGRCVAKTGTLDGVTNLAGYCASRGGHELAFGLFVDGPDNATAFELEGRMLAAIARY